MISRRPMLAGVALAMLAGPVLAAASDERETYGMIGKIRCKPGKRLALAKVLNGDFGPMPGCISYLIAADLKDEDVIWVAEFWESKLAHDESLTLPGVKEAIAEGRPLIAAFEMSVETRPILDSAT